jgi:sugar phosphate isomerase/epimerase
MNNALSITLIENGPESAPQVLKGELTGSLRKAAELGYDGVEIHVVDPFDFPVEKIRAACKETGVRIACIVTGQAFTRRHLCLTAEDPEVREKAMREVFAYIDIAASLQATDGIIIGWIKGNRTPGREEEFDQLLAQQLGKLGAYAQERGQKILVECINRYETNVFNTADELMRFIARFQIAGVYVQLDTFHMNIEEVDPAATIRACGKQLGFIQFADSNRSYLGAGHIDFAPIMQALSDIQYTGSLSLECLPGADPIRCASVSRKFLDNYRKKLL